MFAPRNRRKKRIDAKRTKGKGEPLQIIVADLLIGKGEDMMFKPCRSDCGDCFRR
jgi:hypothetical protein